MSCTGVGGTAVLASAEAGAALHLVRAGQDGTVRSAQTSALKALMQAGCALFARFLVNSAADLAESPFNRRA